MAQFAAWLKQRYSNVSALNAGWGTSFTSFDLDPINARKGGEAATCLERLERVPTKEPRTHRQRFCALPRFSKNALFALPGWRRCFLFL